MSDSHDAANHASAHNDPARSDHAHTATYLVIFALLMVLLAATVGVAFVDFGQLMPGIGDTGARAVSLAATLLVATTKALLVALFFMHLIYGQRLTAVVAASAVVWLAIALVLTLADYLTRGWLGM